jgi:hypothetical protein
MIVEVWGDFLINKIKKIECEPSDGWNSSTPCLNGSHKKAPTPNCPMRVQARVATSANDARSIRKSFVPDAIPFCQLQATNTLVATQ